LELNSDQLNSENEFSFPKFISFLSNLFKDLPYLLSWSEEKNDAGN